MREANVIYTKHIHPEDTTWLVDGLAAVKVIKPSKTLREWISILIKYMLPTHHISM